MKKLLKWSSTWFKLTNKNLDVIIIAGGFIVDIIVFIAEKAWLNLSNNLDTKLFLTFIAFNFTIFGIFIAIRHWRTSELKKDIQSITDLMHKENLSKIVIRRLLFLIRDKELKLAPCDENGNTRLPLAKDEIQSKLWDLHFEIKENLEILQNKPLLFLAEWLYLPSNEKNLSSERKEYLKELATKLKDEYEFTENEMYKLLVRCESSELNSNLSTLFSALELLGFYMYTREIYTLMKHLKLLFVIYPITYKTLEQKTGIIF